MIMCLKNKRNKMSNTPNLETVLSTQSPILLEILLHSVNENDEAFKAHTRDWLNIIFKEPLVMSNINTYTYEFNYNDFTSLLYKGIDAKLLNDDVMSQYYQLAKSQSKFNFFAQLVLYHEIFNECLWLTEARLERLINDAIQSPSLHIYEFNTLIYHLVFAWQRISKVCRDNLYHTTLQHAGEPVASTISLFSEVPQRTESTDSLELSLLPENMDKNNDISLFNHSSPTCVVEGYHELNVLTQQL